MTYARVMRVLFIFFIFASAEYIVKHINRVGVLGEKQDWVHLSNVQDLEDWLNYHHDLVDKRVIYSVQKIVNPELDKTNLKWKIKQDL